MSSFSMNLGDPTGEGARRVDQQAFRMVVLGDFSGRENRRLIEGGSEIASRRARRIDRDNLDEVLEQLGARIVLPGVEDEHAVDFRPQEIDDFHPDRLFECVRMFDGLRDTRRRLLNPATFAEAASEVRGWAGLARNGQAPTSGGTVPDDHDSDDDKSADQPPTDRSEVSHENLLEQMLDETQRTGPARPAPGQPDWNSLLREIAAPYRVPGTDPQQAELVACVEDATAKFMSTLLHHREFQALEAAWRGLDFLVRRVETDARLKLYLVDVSKAELAADLAGNELNRSGLFNLLVEQTVGTPGTERWTSLVGLFEFDNSPADVKLLSCLAKIASAAEAPFVSAASGRVVGCEQSAGTADPDDWRQLDPEAQRRWDTLRQLPEAAYLGLIWPKFLLRLPYGNKTNPIEAFDFEEMPRVQPEHYLWGNPALAWATLLGQAFCHSGWELRLGQTAELTGLPLHVYEQEGESQARPCGELLLGERGARQARDRGLSPLLSVRDQDAILLPGVISVAGRALPGSWQ